MQLLERRPGTQARIFAEAQSLIEEGLDRALVLELYPEEAEWLAPLLSSSEAVIGAYAPEEPTWYFEASLKQKFIEAGVRKARREPAVAQAPLQGWSRMRAGLAGSGVAAGAAVLGFVALGFLTADGAQPGDWNYVFRVGSDRLDYHLSDGSARVSVQLTETDRRVQDIINKAGDGAITAEELGALEKEAETLARLAENQPFDDEQKDKLREIDEAADRVLSDVSEKQPELEDQVKKTQETVDEAVAAGLGGSEPLAEPSPSPSPTPAPTEAPAEEPSATPEQSADGDGGTEEAPADGENP
jgi:hypothetical protein